MIRIFRAEKMLTRLEREGRMNEVTKEDLDLIHFLDGKEGNDYNWQSVVNDEPLVWIEKDGDFNGVYVALVDCD